MAAPSLPFPLQLDTVKFGEDVLYRLLDNLFTEGVIADGDGEVTQFGSGEMRVNVAAGDGYLDFDTPEGGKRQLNWPATQSGLPGAPNAADLWLSTFAAAHATLPRIDRVVATVQDASLDATGQRRHVWQVIGGTATSGADLANLNGVQAVPANSMLFANVLVRAATSALLTADIDTRIGLVRPKSGISGRVAAVTGWTKLAEIPVAAPQASIDFTGIVSTFKHLRVVGQIRKDSGAQSTVRIRFNGDTAANYQYGSLAVNGSVAAVPLAAGGATGILGPAILSTAGIWTPLVLDIPNYLFAQSKGVTMQSENASGNQYVFTGSGRWNSTAAINRITIDSADAANLAANSVLSLYGIL